MPASLTRACRVCKVDKPTPSAFRELDELDGAGRPPRTCRTCRHADPALMAAYVAQAAKRHESAAFRERMRARTSAALKAATTAAHPDGLKVCPDIAGCGLTLPVEAFTANRTMADGLDGVCAACREEYKATRRAKAAGGRA